MSIFDSIGCALPVIGVVLLAIATENEKESEREPCDRKLSANTIQGFND